MIDGDFLSYESCGLLCPVPKEPVQGKCFLNLLNCVYWYYPGAAAIAIPANNGRVKLSSIGVLMA